VRQQEELDLPDLEVAGVDLHVHSTCSDGRIPPGDVVEAAAAAKLAVLALTDHDTVAGHAEAGTAARAAGIEFVGGIELSTHDESMGGTHLLGYHVDGSSLELTAYLAEARDGRRDRARAIVGRLNGLGVGVTVDDVFAHVSEAGLVARPHVARALLDGGWVRSYREAFERFIAAGRPAYVPAGRITPAEGIALIRGAGGIAVLAHPGDAWSDGAIRDLTDAGLDGIEVLHPEHGRETVRRLRRLAASCALLETGGSDWHGPGGGRARRLGAQPVPYDWHVRLAEAAGVRAGGNGGDAGPRAAPTGTEER
jgi:predicted metal-dependent phosphoesterase TrpH